MKNMNKSISEVASRQGWRITVMSLPVNQLLGRN
jgi:hypothetical protein